MPLNCLAVGESLSLLSASLAPASLEDAVRWWPWERCLPDWTIGSPTGPLLSPTICSREWPVVTKGSVSKRRWPQRPLLLSSILHSVCPNSKQPWCPEQMAGFPGFGANMAEGVNSDSLTWSLGTLPYLSFVQVWWLGAHWGHACSLWPLQGGPDLSLSEPGLHSRTLPEHICIQMPPSLSLYSEHSLSSHSFPAHLQWGLLAFSRISWI